MVKNLPSKAEDMGLSPGQEIKIPHARGQLSPHTATTEPTHSRAHAPQLESPHTTTTEPMRSGARALQLERSLCTAMKSPHAAMKIPCAATKT